MNSATDYAHEFPILENQIFFNHSAVAPLPARAARAIERWAPEAQTDIGSRWPDWATSVPQSRVNAAKMMGCEAGEIALVHNTTHGILIVANSLDWRPGDNVIVAEHEFPANLYPWMNLAARGVACRFVPEREGRFKVEDFIDQIDDRTRLIAVSMVQYSTGFRMPIERLGEICAERGVLLCVDGIQSLGCLPVDVEELGCSFFVADGHKWLLSVEGLGALYIRRSVMDRLNDSMTGWIGRVPPNDYDKLDKPLSNMAKRFEEGSHSIVSAIAFEQSTALLLEVGAREIWSRIEAIGDRLVQGLSKLGFEVVSSREPEEKSGIVAFKPTGGEASEWVKRLEERKIFLVGRRGYLRASPHFYNTAEQADAFLEALSEIKAEF